MGAEIFGTSGKVFSALLSKLHFASPVDDSHTFSQHFLFFEHLRDMSSKCWDIRRKNLGTVFSKQHSSCTDEYFERKLIFGKNFLHILSFLEFNQKKFRVFEKVGTIVETAFYVCKQEFVLRRKKIPGG